MKKIKVLFSIIIIFWILFISFSINATTSFLSFSKSEILEEGSLFNGVNYEKVKANTYTDSGTLGTQNLSFVEASKSSQTKVITWSLLSKTGLKAGTTLDIARNFEQENPGWTVLAAVNGDYYDPNTMNPVNAFVRNGDVIKPFNHSKYLSLAINGEKDYIASYQTQTENKYTLSIYDDEGKYIIEEYLLDNQNILPNDNSATFFQGISSRPQLSGVGVYDVEITTQINLTNQFTKGRITETNDDSSLWIVSRNNDLNSLLDKNPKIRIQKYLTDEYNDYDNVVGVGSQPLNQGAILSFLEIGDQNEVFAATRNPRSAIGFTANGGVVIAAFDGRQQGMSGVNLREMAVSMRSLGCVDAFTLDGGGSTQMVIRKDGVLSFLNNPSETYRRVANAILIVAPDIYISSEHSNVERDNFILNYQVKTSSLVSIKSISIIVDGNDSYNIISPVSLNYDDNRNIHYYLFLITYEKGGNEYERVFFSRRINTKNYNFSPPEKVLPSNFTVDFELNLDKKGFDAIINFLDPDDRIVKIYLINDGKKEIAIKDSRGYVCKYYNLHDSQQFVFSIEYHFMYSSLTPEFMIYSEEFIYNYVGLEEDGNDENSEEKASGCKFLSFQFILMVLGYLIIRRKHLF